MGVRCLFDQVQPIRAALCALAILTTGSGAARATPEVEHLLLAQTPEEAAQFGYAVAIGQSLSGEVFAVVGAYNETVGGLFSAGAVHVYRRDSARQWTEEAVLQAADPGAADFFGLSVDLLVSHSHVTIVVGAPNQEDTGSPDDAGAAYIFERNKEGSWTQTRKLLPPVRRTQGFFGFPVSIGALGPAVIIGESCSVGPGPCYEGSAYVFSHENGWTQIAQLTGTEPDVLYAAAVEICDEWVMVGAPLESNGAGAVYVYSFDALKQECEFVTKLTTSTGIFGESIDIHGNHAVIGAGAPGGEERAFVFSLEESGWQQETMLQASDGTDQESFGNAVAISPDLVLVGAIQAPHQKADAGAVYVFERQASSQWQETGKLTASNATIGAAFGFSVDALAYGGNPRASMAIVGAPLADVEEGYAGAAYVFDSPNVSGAVYRDEDESNDCTPGIDGLGGRLVRINPLPEGEARITATLPNGSYSLVLPTGTYEVSLLPRAHFTQTCPISPPTYQVSIDGNASTNLNFAARADSVSDLKVELILFPAPRSGELGGSSNVYTLTCSNVAGLNETATVTLDLPAEVAYQSSSDGGVFNGNQVTWNSVPLPANAIKNLSVNVRVNANVPLGTVLEGIATIYPLEDANPADNMDSDESAIVGSFDPNDKLVTPEGNIAPDQRLAYRVRFQNVGNAEAINIVVRDTLEADLDLSTLELTAASHPYDLRVEGNEIVWIFESINLPDSTTNEPASHGCVEFEISPKLGLPSGTEITNRAGIYFDFNAAVMTNEVVNTIGTPVAVEGATPFASEFAIHSIHPNPARGPVTIRLALPAPGRVSAEIYDVSGRRVRRLSERAVNGSSVALDWDGCNGEGRRVGAGIYLSHLRYTSEKGLTHTASKRIVLLR